MPRATSDVSSAVALDLATSANGVERNGSAFPLANSAPGSLSILCESRITTSAVSATFRAQVSEDGSTWHDVVGATTTTPNGTGSEVITRRALVINDLTGWRFMRVVAVLAGATTAPADRTRATYRYRIHGAD